MPLLILLLLSWTGQRGAGLSEGGSTTTTAICGSFCLRRKRHPLRRLAIAKCTPPRVPDSGPQRGLASFACYCRHHIGLPR